jgi:hypothetical protein
MSGSPLPPITYMFTDDISKKFRDRGWVRGSGGDLYYNGNSTTEHPHLHLRIRGQRTVRVGGDIRLAVSMLAWSDGQQGRGGGGWTYIRDGEIHDRNWRRNQPSVRSGAVIEEFAWIMDYFANG